ncbi:MAG TPA: CerR family C-terminal domain-containing protein [Amaricoccus sp.]|jgi:AcrR family transcriptional regulator|nr:CerR family C-terminal domain-containing protein [Amaricoccus sp.]
MATTREAILEAALRGFGEKGFAATGIREIAAAAGCNVAAISYHFGGKEGLRAACAEHVVARMGAVLAAARAGEPAPADPAAAEATLSGLVRVFAYFLLLQPDGQLVAGFVLREMAAPSSALDTIYAGIFEEVHARACDIWSVATGAAPDSAAVRLAVFATIGQILYFHVARPVVARRMGWKAIGPEEAEAVVATILRNLHTRLAADRESAR